MATGLYIARYNPLWPQLYERASCAIRTVLGQQLFAIEHIGSTAVPGLAARPIVDLMAGITQLAEVVHCVEPLSGLGYELDLAVTRRLGLHDDRLFMQWEQGRKTIHLHVTAYGGGFWQEKLLFRDFLRAHPESTRQYEALKRRLAPQFNDGPAYSTAKTAFIQAALREARATKAGAEHPGLRIL